MLYLRIRVDPAVSAPLNEGNQQIDTVLVLRLENGKDLYIVVKGRYIPTCLGIHLDRLALMSLPVSSMSSHPNPGSKKNGHATTTTTDNTSTQQATLPKELWRVLNYLWNKSMLSIVSMLIYIISSAISKLKIRICIRIPYFCSMVTLPFAITSGDVLIPAMHSTQRFCSIRVILLHQLTRSLPIQWLTSLLRFSNAYQSL